MQERRDRLINELRYYDCELRSDSKICNNYIKNGKGNVRKIALIMNEHNFYYTKTRYKEIYKNMKQNLFYLYMSDNEEDYKTFTEYAENLTMKCKQKALEEWIEENPNLIGIPSSLESKAIDICSYKKYLKWMETQHGITNEDICKDLYPKYVFSTSNALFKETLDKEIKAFKEKQKTLLFVQYTKTMIDSIMPLNRFSSMIKNSICNLVAQHGWMFENTIRECISTMTSVLQDVYIHMPLFNNKSYFCELCNIPVPKHSYIHHTKTYHNIPYQKICNFIARHYWLRDLKAAILIQTCWRRAIACPDYNMCKNRLMREFSVMQ